MGDHRVMTDEARMRRSRDDVVVTLYDLFRRRGFEGVSLSDISEATGLGRSSLYHHFPGGKDDMAAAVTDFATEWIGKKLLAPLRTDAPIDARIAEMLAATRRMYGGGATPCLVASLIISPGLDQKSVVRIRNIVRDWIGGIASALTANGLPGDEARRRATASIIAIQGALLVARACGEDRIFGETLDRLQQELLS